MPNGKHGDHPISDTLLHGLHPFPEDIERLVVEVHARNHRVFNDLGDAPFDWERGEYLREARTLLKGLVDNHGDPVTSRRLVEEYLASAKDRGRSV